MQATAAEILATARNVVGGIVHECEDAQARAYETRRVHAGDEVGCAGSGSLAFASHRRGRAGAAGTGGGDRTKGRIIMKDTLATTITPPRKYAFDSAGRVRHVARALGVKLPSVKGRKPKMVNGDEDAFMRAIGAHHDRNALRNAIEAVLDLAGDYHGRLTDDERRQLSRPLPRRRSWVRWCASESARRR